MIGSSSDQPSAAPSTADGSGSLFLHRSDVDHLGLTYLRLGSSRECLSLVLAQYLLRWLEEIVDAEK
jgi:hypothetical protein